MPIAAVIITRNEAANIERCLASLGFCDEIIVVDSGSTDETVSLARAKGAKVFQREWAGYGAQKNHANSLSRFDWILSIDADEEVTPELRREIEAVVQSPGAKAAYSVPRKTIHSGRWIRYGGWYPNRVVRLFRRSLGRWTDSAVHERWETTGNVGELSSDLNHYSFRDIADQVVRNNVYSTLGALRLREEGGKFSLGKLLLKPVSKFIETYVIKRGFLDGYRGFIISVSAAYSVFLKWAKLWEVERDQA